ncbi:MAG: murein biosynthesis integral membrane protein MurJ [Clostridia bacterium]|nr:murein biosynthesis integral membrane protein MurJ [Clostridia bacterium]
MSENKTLLKTTMSVTLIIFISKAGGFLREIIMTAYYGAGMEMDAYNMAYSLFYMPVLLFNSCITSTLVPLYVSLAQNKPRRRLDEFSSRVINLYGLMGIAVSVLMFIFARPLVRLTGQGFDPGKQDLTVQLLRLMLPALAFIVVSIILASILNARQKYMAAQLTGFPLTIALLIATIGFSDTAGIRALAVGVFVSGVLQAAILLPFLRKELRYKPSFNFADETLKRMVVLAAPAVLSMAVNELNHMIDKMLASGLPEGHLSCMNLAFRLITFLTGVVLVPLETINFSRMSIKTASHDKEGVGKIVTQSAELVALIIFPIIAVGAIMSRDVIRLAYMHGRFNEASVGVSAVALTFYIRGVYAFGMRDILNRAFHACQDTRTPMVNSVITMVLNIALNIVLVRVMGVGGLALATSIAASVGVLLLLTLLRRRIGPLGGLPALRQLGLIAVATAAAGAVCWAFNRFCPPAHTSPESLLRLVIGTGLSLLVYAGAAVFLKVEQVAEVRKLIRSKLRRRAG